MQPHIDEAWRSLRLADRDIAAFHILRSDPAAHASIINFHAQQFAITFRYDDTEIGAGMPGDQVDSLVTKVREWAEQQIGDTSNPDRIEEDHST